MKPTRHRKTATAQFYLYLDSNDFLVTESRMALIGGCGYRENREMLVEGNKPSVTR